MSLKPKLLLVAHPDDETIFFGGIVQQNPKSFHIVCVTDGNADGRGSERKKEFEKACVLLGADSFEMWDFPDIYEQRLDQGSLQTKIKTLGAFDEVFTHCPYGEYGHPHHQDVSRAVFDVFPEQKIFCASYNAYPDMKTELGRQAYETKSKILLEVYGEETKRFLNLIAITHSEGVVRISKQEADSVYAYLSGKSQALSLKKYARLRSHIKGLKEMERLF